MTDPITLCVIGQLGFALDLAGTLHLRLICNIDGAQKTAKRMALARGRAAESRT